MSTSIMMKTSCIHGTAPKLSLALVAFCSLVACGGGGDSEASIGVVNFPSVRSLPSPSGVSQLSSASDALLWARTGNTAVDFNELINQTGFGLLAGYLLGFESIPVGTTFANSICGTGFVNVTRYKQSSADVTVGDYLEASYGACSTGGYTFNGTIRAQLVGVLSSGSAAAQYRATSFSATDGATSVSYSNISAVINHAFNAGLSAYSATSTTGTYFNPVAGALYENGTYTINNAVVSSTLSGDIVTGSRFGMDVIQGALSLKVDTETPLVASGSTLTFGNVQILNSGFLSRVRVTPNGGNSRVSLDAANDGVFETFTDTSGQLVF